MHHWCHLGPCTYGGGKHMSALQSAMNENNREPTNIALALHNQVLATEGQPPHQVGHPEYTQDLPLKGPPMPILSKTPTPPQAKPTTVTGWNRNHWGRAIHSKPAQLCSSSSVAF